MTEFVKRASDVAAFAKNAGPQCLRIDYLGSGSRLAFYTPDFFIRTTDGNYCLVETKGREDRDVPIKARAAIAWCESATVPECKWEYLYVPQGVFERMHGDTIAELARTCRPALQNLLEYEETKARYPLFASIADEEEKAPSIGDVIDESLLDGLPRRHRKAVEQAVELLQFFSNKEGMNYAPVFNALLGVIDESAKGLMLRRLQPALPATVPEQKAWFTPYLERIDNRTRGHYQNMAQNLKRTLVFNMVCLHLGCCALAWIMR